MGTRSPLACAMAETMTIATATQRSSRHFARITFRNEAMMKNDPAIARANHPPLDFVRYTASRKGAASKARSAKRPADSAAVYQRSSRMPNINGVTRTR